MPRELDRIQRWLQSVIMHPQGVAEGIESEAARTEIDVPTEQVEDVICRSQSQNSIERLEVYGNAYYSRLMECLREEFSAVAHAVGEETFDSFAFEYLQTYPSKSYTLSDLGAKFPDYLRETRPAPDPAEGEGPDWADFLIDLAALERVYSDVFDGPGIETEPPLTSDDFAKISPEAWPEARLIPAPCFRLIELRFPVHEYITALRENREPEIPAAEPTWLAITRRHYVVRRIPVTRAQYALLQALAAEAPVGEAIERVALSQHGLDIDRFAADLQEWFRDWSSSRLFSRIDLPKA